MPISIENAISNNNFRQLRRLIKEIQKSARVDLAGELNTKFGSGDTPLSLAVENEHLECVGLLLQAGAGPGHAVTRGYNKWTPLALAAYAAYGPRDNKACDIIRLLVHYQTVKDLINDGNFSIPSQHTIFKLQERVDRACSLSNPKEQNFQVFF